LQIVHLGRLVSQPRFSNSRLWNWNTGFPNSYPDLEHFGGGEQSGGGIGDILASRRVKCVLRPGLKHSQI
jgi:hypothetical protein